MRPFRGSWILVCAGLTSFLAGCASFPTQVLLDPARLERLYRTEVFGGETMKLLPKEAGLPELKATGRKGLLHTLEWTDPTGARQKLELLNPKAPVALPPETFRPTVPAGTRWSTPNG